MTLSTCIQAALLIAALACIVWAWNIPTTYEGDADLGEAIAKLVCYMIAVVIAGPTLIWIILQHLVFR